MLFRSLAGILSATVSSPNSHPALLAPLFGTVIAFTPNALENKTWNQWAKKGESVYLKISTKWEDSAAEIYLSKVSSVDEYQRLIEVKKSSRVTVGELKIDRKTSKIVPTFELSSDMIPAYGAKSANFGFLQQLFKGEDVTVDGLGIPVYFQSEFFNNAHISADLKLSDYITKQIAVASSADTTVAEIVSILEDVRNKILQAEVPQALLEQMNTALNNAYPDKTTTLFLRSSANVEDLKGFNGAGLYDSKKLKVRDNLAELANAIKVVWASPYKFNAFMARKNSQIDESKVGMAVLVNPFLQNVRSQGVISTTEPRREYDEFRMNLVSLIRLRV